MAQDFERRTLPQVGTVATALGAAFDSDDAIISIRIANVTSGTVTADCYIYNGSANIYLVKGISIPTGSSVELIDGASRFVVQNNDRMYFVSDTASALDVWVSVVDTISS
jgi:hypothetical protein